MQLQTPFINTDKPQPPRPESRSDSFARADALLREHNRQQQQQQQLAAGNAITEQQKQPVGQDFAVSRNHVSRPESRNRIVCSSTTTLAGNVERTTTTTTTDHVDGGLLTMVDQQSSSARNNPDPLVSLIQSLAEISPIRSSQSVTNNNNNNNKTDTNDHHHASSIGAATTTTASSNVVNVITNCSPNQSPKAWQNCTQVCLPVFSCLARRSSF